MSATGYSQGMGASRLYPVASGLKLVTGHNQRGKQIELTIISNKQPSSQTERTLHG